MFVLPIPDTEFLKEYKFSSKILAGAYIFLAAMNSSVLFFGLSDYQAEYFKFSAILVSSTQSLIFIYTLLTLLNPHLNRKNSMLFSVHAFIILLFLFLFVAYFTVFNDLFLASVSDLVLHITHPLTVLRIAFFVFYLYQIIVYSLIFHKSILSYNASIKNYYSETAKIKMNWIKVAFISALAIGLMAIAFQIIPSLLLDNIFTSIVVVFYMVFAIKFINYNTIYHIIEPALDTAIPAEAEIEITQKKSSWDLYRIKVLENKYFLIEGITLIEMALLLNVSRTTLSNFINAEENQNFNSWTNQLRISEAKILMMRNPEFSISHIAMKTGYSEQSNFSREFKQVTGETPSAWKKNNIASY